MSKVLFASGLSARFNELESKDANTLYFLTDTQQIYKGNVLYNSQCEVVSELPATGVQGKLYINSTDLTMHYWTGTAFKQLSDTYAGTFDEANDAKAPTVKAVKDYVATVKTALEGTADNASTATTIAGAKKYAEEKAAAATNDSKITITASDSSEYAKVYTISQGGTELATKINIPKDMVVSSGQVIDKNGVKTLEIILNNGQNVDIPVGELVDAYTAAADATEVQVAIAANNEISATVVKVDASKITHGESDVETALTAAEATITKLDGDEDTPGSVANALKEAKSAATTAETNAKKYTDDQLAELDADLDATGTAVNDGVFVVSGITQENGEITAVDSLEVEKAGAAAAALLSANNAIGQAEARLIGTDEDTENSDTIKGAKKYADKKLDIAIEGANEAVLNSAKTYTDSEIQKLDANLSQTAGADGLALTLTQVDGKVTAISGSIAAETYDNFGAAAAVQTYITENIEPSITWTEI